MRYKIDAMAELHTVEGKLASARKSLDRTANSTTAKVELSKIPGLERKAAELRAEIETLPERPPLFAAGGRSDGNFPCLSRTTPLSETERDQLEIPEFLRRLA